MSGELMYYRAIAKVEIEVKGKVKYHKEQYIVQAISPTDVEAKMNEHLKNVDFEIDSIAQTRIINIVK